MTSITQGVTPSKYANVITTPSAHTAASSSLSDSFENNYGNKRSDSLSLNDEFDMYTFVSVGERDREVRMIVEDAPKVISAFSQPAAVATAPKTAALKSGAPTGSKVTPGGTKYNTYENDEAQKKFAGAKAISSDQFFNKEATTFERSANMAKFQGSNSISSAEYFGDGPGTAGGRSGSSRSKFTFTRHCQ